MSKTDEGEFELVLGNRQLLSGFFIVVILFGIFFTMGYIVGRHSSPTPLNTVAAAASDPAPPRQTSGSPPPGQAEVIPVEAKSEAPLQESPQSTGTQPATAPPESARSMEARQPEPRSSGSGLAEPAPGSYLQVAAPKRAAAGGVVDSLKYKGIAAVLAPGPNDETVRVLVGPLDSSTIGKMRIDLETAGFKPFPKKY